MCEGGTRSRHGRSTGLKAGDRLRRAWREAKVEMKQGKAEHEREEEERGKKESSGGFTREF